MKHVKRDFILDFEKRQALLASIVQSSEDAIISKDLTGHITSWNQSAVALLGYEEDEALGEHISLIIPENRLDGEDSVIATILKGEKLSNFRTVRKTKSGREL